MTRQGWTVPPDDLTIPALAGPTDPRIVITGAPPAEIGYPLDAAILFYFNGTDFFFIGVSAVGNGGTLATGFRSATTGDTDYLSESKYDNVTRLSSHEVFTADYSTGAPTNPTFLGWTPGVLRADTTEHRVQAPRLTINSDDAPQVAHDVELTNAAVGGFTAETVIHTLQNASSEPYKTTRRYQLHYTGRIQSTTAGDRVGLRVRFDTVAGTITRDCGELVMPAVNVPVPVDISVLYTGRNVAAEKIVLTARRTAGAGTLTYNPDAAWSEDLVATSLP